MNTISGNLGKLCKYVKINENENKIAAIPITDWIGKKYWRRINDILSLRGLLGFQADTVGTSISGLNPNFYTIIRSQS